MLKQLANVFLMIAITGCSADSPFARKTEYLSPTELPNAASLVAGGDFLTAGKVAFADQNYGLAVQYYTKATEEDATKVNAWLGLAASADRAGHFAKSKPAYSKVYKLVGPVFEYHNNVGFSYLMQGRYSDAERAFKAALRIKPGSKTSKNNLALLGKLR